MIISSHCSEKSDERSERLQLIKKILWMRWGNLQLIILYSEANKSLTKTHNQSMAYVFAVHEVSAGSITKLERKQTKLTIRVNDAWKPTNKTLPL